MVNLGRLRCLQPGCRSPGPLLLQEEDLLLCPRCGTRRTVRAYFLVYQGQTGQWLIAGAVWMAVGAGRGGLLRALLVTLGALFVLYGLGRALFQALALRALRKDPPP